MKNQTGCFFGDRKLPEKNIEDVLLKLNREIDLLISKGITRFLSGGDRALEGVDTR